MSKSKRLIGATVKDGQSFLTDAISKQHLRHVGKKGAKFAETTSLVVVVLYLDGTAITYDLDRRTIWSGLTKGDTSACILSPPCYKSRGAFECSI